MVDARALSTLIGSIYDCTLDPSRWDETLGDIRDVLDCQTAVLHLNDLGRNRVLIQEERRVGAILAGAVCETCSWWSCTACSRRSLPSMSRRCLAPYRGSGDRGVCVRPRLAEAATHRRHHAALSHAHAVALLRARHCLKRSLHGLVTDRDVELACSVAAASAPRGFDQQRARRPHHRAARLAEALDALRCAVVLTDARGAILHANDAAAHAAQRRSHPGHRRGAAGERPVGSSGAARCHQACGPRRAQIGKTGLAIRLGEPDVPPVFVMSCP